MEYYFDILCLVTLYKDEKRYVEIYCQSPLSYRTYSGPEIQGNLGKL